jgi:hypothetical protein
MIETATKLNNPRIIAMLKQVQHDFYFTNFMNSSLYELVTAPLPHHTLFPHHPDR